MLFEHSTPTTYVFPQTLSEAQAAITSATPGTAIVTPEARWSGFLRFDFKRGEPNAPIWLCPIRPLATEIFDTSRTATSAIIAIWRSSNIAVSGFRLNCTGRGMYAGAVVWDIQRGVLILGNEILDAAEDGVKVDHADGVEVRHNIVKRAGQRVLGELIDFVSVHGGLIADNDVSECRSSAGGIVIKAGTRSVTIERNHVYKVQNPDGEGGSGILLGGTTGSDVIRPGDEAAECFDSISQQNYVHDVQKYALFFKGAHGCHSIQDRLIGNPGYAAAVMADKRLDRFSRECRISYALLGGTNTRISTTEGSQLIESECSRVATLPPSLEPASYTDQIAFLKKLYAVPIPYAVQGPPDCSECEAKVETLTASLATSQANLARAESAIEAAKVPLDGYQTSP